MAQITGPTRATLSSGAEAAPAAAAKPAGRASAALRAGERTAKLTPYVFLGVPLLLYAVWVIGPMAYSFYVSLTTWDGISNPTWAGFANYRQMWHDDLVRTAFWNNVRWLIAFITVPTVCGLGLALLLNNNLPGVRFFKAGIFSPMVLSSVVIANVWSWMYAPRDGLINTTLDVVGFGEQHVNWLGDPQIATWSIVGASIWRQIGYVMLIYLAGLKNVDPSLVDASKVDGANAWHSFKDVVFPLLQPVTVIVVVVSIIDALRAFDLVNLMTDGGPYGRTEVLSHRVYEEAFNNYNMGYAAAIAVVLMLITMIFIFSYLFRMAKEELEY